MYHVYFTIQCTIVQGCFFALEDIQRSVMFQKRVKSIQPSTLETLIRKSRKHNFSTKYVYHFCEICEVVDMTGNLANFEERYFLVSLRLPNRIHLIVKKFLEQCFAF